ncbi:MAG: hypothetical protein ACRCSG_01225 [Cellulosilyticaceae bacterium]
MEAKINEQMKKHDISFEMLSKHLSVSKQTLTRKMKGDTEWTYPEMILLGKLLHIDDVANFFFG